MILFPVKKHHHRCSIRQSRKFPRMEHLTGILNYLNILVMPNKLPVSVIEKNIQKNGFIEVSTAYTLNNFMGEVIQFNRMFDPINSISWSVYISRFYNYKVYWYCISRIYQYSLTRWNRFIRRSIVGKRRNET